MSGQNAKPTGADAAKAPGTTQRKTSNARVQYVTVNQGAPNEHLIMIQEFKKPGNYSYGTSITNYPKAGYIKPEDQGSLNRGLTRAWEMVSNPVLPQAEVSFPLQMQQSQPEGYPNPFSHNNQQ